MKKLILTLILLISASFVYAEEGEGCLGADVTKEEVQKALSPLIGNVKVEKVSPSPIEDLYEVILDTPRGKIPVYVDCSLNYLITGSIIDIKNKRDLTREKAMSLAQQSAEEKIKKLEKLLGKEKVEKLKKALGPRFNDIKLVDLNEIPKKHLITYGNPKAKYTIYVVTDPECPFCAKFDKEMKKLLKMRNDVKFEVILFPLPFHKHASPISQNILCEKSAAKQKEILDKSFEYVRNKQYEKLSSLEKSCKEGKDIISEHFAFGSKAGISGTPTLIFPHGIIISGLMSADQMNKVLDALK